MGKALKSAMNYCILQFIAKLGLISLFQQLEVGNLMYFNF